MKKPLYYGGFLFILFTTFSGLAQENAKKMVQPIVDKEYPELQTLYKDIHQHPELSFHEKNTSEKLTKELESLGFTVTQHVGGYGIVGVLKNGEGPTILVRTDMDALPVQEKTGLLYASKVKTTDDAGKEVPVMHACGHDVHMAVWTGTAKVMAKLKDKWHGTLVFIGQPAEERSGGAKEMLADGLYERFPKPDYALALHDNAALAAGDIAYTPGYALANVDMVDIDVFGEGGHGAYPHLTKDPVVLSAQIIMGLQTIVSREINPQEPAVVTVGAIQGGNKGNVIPDSVHMELTLRSYTDEVRNALIAKIKRICKGQAMAAGMPEDRYPVVTVRDEYTPALYNDPKLTKELAEVFAANLGKAHVKEVPPVMGGEDFGRFGRTEDHVPICLFWLGAVAPEKVEAAKEGKLNLPSLHSAEFAPVPEPTIKTGVLAMSSALLHLMK